MAIEDEIINITDIDVGTEILNSDKLLIETSDGTKMIAFKDFVVGPDNISSVRQSQIEGNVEGEADTFYNVVTGFQILNNQTTPGLNTQYDQISGSIELGKFNYNAIANLASVSADIATNASALAEVSKVLDSLAGVIQSTNNTVLKSVTLTTSACNANVTGAFSNHKTKAIGFTKALLDPSTTNEHCTIQLNPFTLTFPEVDEGFVDGSRYMFTGSFSIPANQVYSARPGFHYETFVVTCYRDTANGSEQAWTQSSSTGTVNFNQVVRVNLGDVFRFQINGRARKKIKSGSLDVFKLS